MSHIAGFVHFLSLYLQQRLCLVKLLNISMEFNKMKKYLRHHDGRVVLRIPDAIVLRILSRSLFLTMVLATLIFLGTVLKGFSSSSLNKDLSVSSGSLDVGLLNSILRDVTNEGLLKENVKALVVNSPVPNDGFGKKLIDVVMDSDSERKSLFPDESYDFVFTSGAIDAEFIDRVLKIDGIVALPLGAKPSNSAFRGQTNYRVVFLKRYGFVVVVALKKTRPAIKLVDFDSSPRRKLLATKTKPKPKPKAVALNDLEDVLLEPPRKAMVKSRKLMNNIKYLPDLMDDSLEGYSRRVFIGIGLPEENKGVMQWFEDNYPKKNTNFETHSIAIAPEDRSQVSEWLSKNVKQEEYVVMKAEAEVVEEMMKKRTIGLVDELFLECKNEWWQTENRKKNGRAYWECLSLYGMLKDEGVAVHQWWGYFH